MDSHAEHEFVEEIAIVGMACRFPGANNLDEFWENLKQGVESCTEFSDAELLAAGVAPETLSDPNYVKAGYILEDVEHFDAGFFGFSPRQALLTDPQQRLFLECAWTAFENAGVDVTTTNKIIGVYAGAALNRYLLAYRDTLSNMDPSANHLQRLIGNDKDYLATQTAYQFNLRGPAINAQTACSTGLVLVHMASQSLLSHECDLALVGSTTLYIPQNVGYDYQENGIFSPDGHCRTFDANGKGTIFGNGVAAIVLKRLSDAVADGDHIWAVVKGAAVNNDGSRKVGFTAPSADGQARVITEAQAVAGVTPEEISYIEAHGTATQIGDPIELEALTTVFAAGGSSTTRQRTATCALGAVKTNIGHLEVVAGMAGLIKTALMLYHKELPPSLHLTTLNPNIQLAGTPFYVNTQLKPWTTNALPRCAGVSSFGIGGTNAHVILGEAPTPATNRTPERPSYLLTLRAKNRAALRALAERYSTFLATAAPSTLGDICYTSHVGRADFDQRMTVVGATPAVMQQRLNAFLAAGPESRNEGIAYGQRAERTTVAFLFTGQGAQYLNMGRQLYEAEPAFRNTIDQCEALFQQETGESLLAILYPGDSGAVDSGAVDSGQSLMPSRSTENRLDETTYTQPALFVLEYALAKLWQAWGVQPTVLLGHSVGELAAACVAGIFRLEDGLKLVAARGRLMGALPSEGAMVALMTTEARVQQAIATYDTDPSLAEVSIAAVNSPDNTVISGQEEAVLAIAEQLAAEGVKTRRLTVSHAFHSPLMEPMLDDFAKVAQSITYHQPKLPIVSNITGQLSTDELTHWQYWVRHVREAVRFADSITTLHGQGIDLFLEIGPKPTLISMAKATIEAQNETQNKTLDSTKAGPTMLPSLRAGHDEWEQMLTSLGECYVRGIKVQWAMLDGEQTRQKMVLPAYAFQRERYWPQGLPYPLQKNNGPTSLRPLIDQKVRLPQQKQTIFEKTFSVETLPFLVDHQVYGEVVAPAAGYLALAFSGAELLHPGTPASIQDVLIPQALVLFADESRTVQLITETAGHWHDNGATSFQIVSFTEDEEEPQLHATGRLQTITAAAPTVALHEHQIRCATAIALDTFYETIVDAQIVLGPTFRWVTALWHDGQGEALAQLQMPATLDNVRGYPLFPGLLDSCFQLVGAALFGLHGAPATDARETRLPFAVESLTLYGPCDQEELWCHVQRRSTADDTEWNLVICTATGQVVAEITGFQLRIAPPDAIQGNRLRTDWLYDIEWQAAALPQSTAAQDEAALPDCWLVVGQGTSQQEALVEALQMIGRPCYQLPVQQQGAVATTAVPDIHQRLLEIAAKQHAVGVIYLATVAEATTDATLPQQTLTLYHGLLALTQALAETTLAARLWVVTEDAHTVSAVQEQQSACNWRAAAGAVAALARTITQELPELHTVSLDLAHGRPVDEQVVWLSTELRAATPQDEAETQVAYRAGTRYVARLARQTLPAHTEKPAATIHEHASYLITGGLGALGLEIAEQLAADGAKHLLLTGRHGVTSTEQRRRLAQLTAAGVEITVIPADIADREQAQALIARCREIAPLRGIVHTAGVLADGILINQTQAQAAEVLHPKVDGTWHLHCLTQPLELDFFVCFSSVVALWGAAGQSNYAAANAFMDTLMQQRRQAGLPGLSINWGPWDVGMAAHLDEAQQERWRASGITSLRAAQGRQLFSALLATAAHGRFAVLPIDWNRLTHDHLSPSQTRLFAHFVNEMSEARAGDHTLQGALPQNDVAELHARLRNGDDSAEEYQPLVISYLQKEVRTILHLPKLPDANQRMITLGIDSLMAVELRSQVRSALQIHLPMTAFIDSSIEQLAVMVTEQLLLANMKEQDRQVADDSLPDTQSEAAMEEFVL